MTKSFALACFACIGGLALAGSASAQVLEIKHAVARVVVIPENRADIKVEVAPGRAALPALKIRTGLGGGVILDGGLNHRIRGCGRYTLSPSTGVVDVMRPPADLKVGIRGQGDVALADAPLVTVRTPMDVKVKSEGAVFGAIARSSALDFSNAGCGDWTLANTAGRLSIGVAGSGDTVAGSAGDAEISLAGSGDIAVGSVRGLEVSIAGSGDVRARQVSGDLEASIAGSGDVTVDSGQIRSMQVNIAGSGDVTVHAAVQTVEANIMGSGDVTLDKAPAKLSKHVMGSGSVVIGR